MSYRDDNDAAFERADALQHEVDRREATIAALRRRLEAVETERARLAELAPREAPPAVVTEARPWSAGATLVFFSLLIVALFAIVILAAH